MPAATMHNVEPTYGYRKNVFTINDVDLIVPPTNIDVQTEDLVWNWRALRQRATTKIPSGQGQVAVQVRIPFTSYMLLDLHRLIVEFRHSPFCYIENRFLRETIVPHWPFEQAMAFTMTGLSVAPMEGSSDTWVMQLDLTWFNYAPYLHNWLYRKDWHSVPVVNHSGLDAGHPVQTTIGWGWEGDRKIQRHIVLPQLQTPAGATFQTWDAVRGQYQDRNELTIEEMETLHQGEIFDLLPLPDRMSPSEFVQRPAQSRIYTRYINYLQRDALMKNFGIDVEGEIHTDTLHNGLFSAVVMNNDRHTFGLHSGPPPAATDLYREWQLLARGILNEFSTLNRSGVSFHFFAYQEVRLPPEWHDIVRDAHQSSLDRARERALPPPTSDLNDIEGWMVRYEQDDVTPLDRVKVRWGMTGPYTTGNGNPRFYSPVGEANAEVPMPVDRLRIGDYPHWRSSALRSQLAGRSRAGSPHWGCDIGGGEGWPIFAMEAGTITKIKLSNNSLSGMWRLINASTKAYIKWDQDDFTNSIHAIDAGIVVDGANVSAQHASEFPVGTFIKSIEYPEGWYFVDGSISGNYIAMAHGQNRSLYLHLNGVAADINVGDQVEAGTLIGYMGGTGPLSKAFIDSQATAAQGQYSAGSYAPSGTMPSFGSQLGSRTFQSNAVNHAMNDATYEGGRIWHYVTHLHFEYWEEYDAGVHRDTDWTGEPIPEGWKNSSRRRVPVDLRGAQAMSVAGQNFFSIDPALRAPTQATVREAVAEEGALQDDGSSPEVAEVSAILDSLWADGWMYYDRDSSMTNVWWKHHHLHIGPGNAEQLSENFLDDPTVLTAVAGGLRHVVANIPVLGHEFPTQQHLGSIEPFYSFEFCSVDFEGKGTQRLAGVSKETEVLLAMRSLLHANARQFRGITDAWCVATDSFVTRLLGTFSDDDVQVATFDQAETGDQPVVSDVEIKRKTMTTRSNSMTVQGHPGLSCHTLEFMETNPYEGETITGSAPGLVDIDAAYREVLNAVYGLKFTEEVNEQIRKILVAQIAGANTRFPGDENYGSFSIAYEQDPANLGNDDIQLYRDTSDREWIILGDDFSPLANAPGSLGGLLSGPDDVPASLRNLNAIPLEEVFGSTATEAGQVLGGGSGGQQAYVEAMTAAANSGRPMAAPTASVVDEIRSITPKDFTIKDLLIASQDTMVIGEIPLTKILDYWEMIHQTIQTAEKILAEDNDQLSFGTITPGGSTIDTVRQELYSLPIVPGLFKNFQVYIATIAAANPSVGVWNAAVNYFLEDFDAAKPAAIKHITENPNWLRFDPAYSIDSEAISELSSLFGVSSTIYNGGWAVFGTAVRTVDVVWETISDGALRLADIAGTVGSGDFGNLPADQKGILTDFYVDNIKDTHRNIARVYMQNLPVRLLLEERFKSYVSQSLFGDVLGSVVGESETPVFANTTEHLINTVASCGDFVFDHFVDAPMYIVSDRTTTASAVEQASRELGLEGEGEDLIFQGGADHVPVPVLQASKGSLGWVLLNRTEGIHSPGSSFIWSVDVGVEQAKLRYFKQLFAKYARDILNDYDMLKAFGLQGLSRINKRARLQGSPALPDMDLPHHPYYGNVAACPPDFYMWNMYEDAGALNKEVQESIYDVMGDIISNCYNSMKRIEGGGSYTPSSDRFVQEPDLDVSSEERITLPQHYNAEGTDSTGPKGATAFPFYPNPDSTEAIAQHIGAINGATEQAVDDAEAARSGTRQNNSKPSLDISQEQARELDSTHVSDVRLSNFEGAFGQGGGIQYPRRVTQSQYDELQLAVESVDQMFGSRSGYLNEREIPENLSDRLRGTLLERDGDPSHRFDRESINQLAKNSASDLFGRKRRLARAYPTFKLFFVEEDEFESRLLNFDDFFSYNGVTSFTVEQSRKSPADHAVITLLNVAGTLDGTKRDAVVDLDYFDKPDNIRVPGEASKFAGDPTVQGSAQDQPFGALVLRPGLNVQLRVGYSNDPDLLEVMINGRVVDVTWNQGGDRAEILVQSFGTELVQAIKGTSAANDSRAFSTTHQLLGAMMLEPELLHFGRWEFGQLYQAGEGQDARLDFNDYSRDAFLGRFRAPNAITKWFLDHPVITATMAIGGGALLTRIPGTGRLLRPVSGVLLNTARAARGTKYFGWVSRWLSTLGTRGPGAAYWRKVLVKEAARNSSGVVNVASKVTQAQVIAAARTTAAQRGLRQMVLENIGNPRLIGEALKIQSQAIRKAAGSTIDDAARIISKADAEIANLVLKGQWMANPLRSLNGQSVGLMRFGLQPIKRIWGGLWYRTPALLAGVGLASLPVAGLDWALSGLYDASFKRLKAYFRSKQTSLFISPQDDNLFPPHPKDYMEIYDEGWRETWNQMKLWVVKQGVSAFVVDDEIGYQAARWFNNPNDATAVLDKRMPPDQANFKLSSTTIWDVFHEMSLRHPGWIYAARPYGTEFRYTMFFGVPSQRYWSQPADNEFIRRANVLNTFLGDSEVSLDEYRRLYGDYVDDGDQTIPLEELDDRIEQEAIAAGATTLVSTGASDFVEVNDPDAQTSTVVELPAAVDTADYSDPAVTEQVGSSIRKQVYTSRALKEYLTALSLRFKPFRRYHSFTSEHDIVWNGLMSSENAVYNAVDVTYFDDDADIGDAPASSAMFKAHAHIPEHQLRILPLQPSYNCRGYQSAMRYGQGALLHTMRDMYRGEIVLLGNPRIRPWDVGILSDSYNDMVGPIEIEQVVHQFSHETGYITEIKPSAFVVANETSSWPIMEAMKVAALAIRDVDDQFQGLGPSDPGLRARLVNWALTFGAGSVPSDSEDSLSFFPGGSNEYKKYLVERAKELQPFDPFANPETGESDIEELREIDEELRGYRAIASGAAVAGVGFLGAAAALKGIPLIKAGTTFTRGTSRLALGGGALAGFGAGVWFHNSLTPSLTWLLGGPVLFLQCLRGDSIMLVPLIKNGHPIVSGLTLSDPSMIWNNVKGELGRWVEDTLDGTRDLTDLWRIYGKHAWRRNSTLNASRGNAPLLDENDQAYGDLTGEER